VRRILDRLVGYQISPLLWKKVRRGLSAGRVQSVAVRVVCEREEEINRFKSEEYWTLDIQLAGENPPPFKARFSKVDGKKAELGNEEQTQAIIDSVKGQPFVVDAITKKQRKRNPLPPFITASLQQEANRRLGYSAKKTMTLAQQLYEGVELGEAGAIGLITYMRTDSTRLSDEAVEGARAFIESNFGKEYLPAKPRIFKTKKKAQDAHEAVRPTYIEYPPDAIKKYLGRDQMRLYSLIWNRFMACQMSPALFDHTGIDTASGNCIFRATGQIEVFDGFLRIYRQPTEDEGDEAEDNQSDLPQLEKGQELKLVEYLPEQHFTQPPPRFTEASLVKELEEKEIGRPSTYAQILANIQDRKYVEKNEKKFQPTELGKLVNELLIEAFPTILDIKFTAQMEHELDMIEEGKLELVSALKNFYGPFNEALQAAESTMRDVKREAIPTDVACDKCDGMMVIKLGRFGQFLACSKYPECKNTKDFKRDEAGEIQIIDHDGEKAEGEVCEKCQKPMTVKRGKFGEFLACTGYPECKNTRKIVKGNVVAADGKSEKPAPPPSVATGKKCDVCGEGEIMLKYARAGSRFFSCDRYPKCKNSYPYKIGLKCPREDCKGELVERSSRYGKIFYGCSEYPECDFTVWKKPYAEACPECGYAFLAESHTKRYGDQLVCPNPDCNYKRPIEEGMVNPIDENHLDQS
jgi:DNA topoisomerase I